MAKPVQNHILKRDRILARAYPTPVTAEIVSGLKEIYDPVAQAPLPVYFARSLGLLYFVTSKEGAAERVTGRLHR